MKEGNYIYVFGVASQFNISESVSCNRTPLPGNAVSQYELDHTQGPQAQLAFPEDQVEIINLAANKGWNSLSTTIFDENTRTEVSNGYLCHLRIKLKQLSSN